MRRISFEWKIRGALTNEPTFCRLNQQFETHFFGFLESWKLLWRPEFASGYAYW